MSEPPGLGMRRAQQVFGPSKKAKDTLLNIFSQRGAYLIQSQPQMSHEQFRHELRRFFGPFVEEMTPSPHKEWRVQMIVEKLCSEHFSRVRSLLNDFALLNKNIEILN